jgi:hypothetical protein
MERKDVLCYALRPFLHPLQNQVSSKLMTCISYPLPLKNAIQELHMWLRGPLPRVDFLQPNFDSR